MISGWPQNPTQKKLVAAKCHGSNKRGIAMRIEGTMTTQRAGVLRRIKRLVVVNEFDRIQGALEQAEEETRRTATSVPRSLHEWITNWMMRGLWRTARSD